METFRGPYADSSILRRELKELPPELHWFCPLYDDATTWRKVLGEDRQPVKTEDPVPVPVEYRRDLAFECLKLFAFDGEDVLPHQEYLRTQISSQLGKCDTCIVDYHKSKHQKTEKMRQ